MLFRASPTPQRWIAGADSLSGRFNELACAPYLTHTIVVLVPEDFPALFVLPILDAGLFSSSNVTIGPRSRFNTVHTRLSALQLRRFFIGEGTGLDSLLDTALLINITLNIGLHALRGG